MTLIIAGAVFGAAVAFVENMMRRIHKSTKIEIIEPVRSHIRRIRRHSSSSAVWEDTVSAAQNVFLNEEHVPRHYDENDITVDIRDNLVEIKGRSSGRHSVDNPVRQLVDTRIEELRWADGTRSVRPLWMPVIGGSRIAWITTPTSEYAIAKRPLSPFSNLTRPAPSIDGKIMDCYYQFVT